MKDWRQSVADALGVPVSEIKTVKEILAEPGTQFELCVPKAASALSQIREILAALPDEAARVEVLEQVLEKRCRKCLDYNPQGQFWCCYDSRGG